MDNKEAIDQLKKIKRNMQSNDLLKGFDMYIDKRIHALDKAIKTLEELEGGEK